MNIILQEQTRNMVAFGRTIKLVFMAVIFLSSQCYHVNGNQVESTPSYDTLIRSKIPTLEVAIPSQKVFRFQFNPNVFGWSNLEGSQESVSRGGCTAVFLSQYSSVCTKAA